jgi:hypothetical protein
MTFVDLRASEALEFQESLGRFSSYQSLFAGNEPIQGTTLAIVGIIVRGTIPQGRVVPSPRVLAP